MPDDFRSTPDSCRLAAPPKSAGLGQIQPSSAIPIDGSLSPDSRRARRMLLTAESGHERSYENVLGHLVAHRGRSGPFQARKDRASHHPVLVALRPEAHLFGEMDDAL